MDVGDDPPMVLAINRASCSPRKASKMTPVIPCDWAARSRRSSMVPSGRRCPGAGIWSACGGGDDVAFFDVF